MTLAFADRTLRIALLAGEILVLAWLFATEDLTNVGYLLLAIALTLGMVALVFSKWPTGCVFLLTIGAALSRFSVTLGGLHLRPEYVATSLAIVAIVVHFGGHVELNLRLRDFDYWLLAYVGMNFFSSLVTSPQPSKTLRWATLNALVIIPYFLIRILIRSDRQIWLALRALLYVGLCEAIWGTLASVSNHVFGTTWGVEVGQYGSIPGTYGTQYEANLFGSYTGCIAVMFLTLFLLSRERTRFWYGWGAMLALLAAVFSLARSVLLGLPIPILAVFFISVRKGQFELRRLLPLAIGLGLVLAMLSPFVLEYIGQRFSTLGTDDLDYDPSTYGRLVQMTAALQDVSVHPVFGTGTSSFQLLFDYSEWFGPVADNVEDNGGAYIGNTPLRVLHDTGVVGLAVFLVFLATLARASYRALRVATHSTKVSIVALSAGLLLYAITFQATEATLLTFTWIHLGLLAAAATVALNHARPPESAPE